MARPPRSSSQRWSSWAATQPRPKVREVTSRIGLLALTQPLTNVRVAAPTAAQIADVKTADLKGDLIMMLKGDLSALIKLLADRAINMLRENTDYARKGDAVPA